MNILLYYFSSISQFGKLDDKRKKNCFYLLFLVKYINAWHLSSLLNFKELNATKGPHRIALDNFEQKLSYKQLSRGKFHVENFHIENILLNTRKLSRGNISEERSCLGVLPLRLHSLETYSIHFENLSSNIFISIYKFYVQ